MSHEPGKTGFRLRTAATDKRKALDHYQELRRSGKSKRAVVISEDEAGDITVLGQMLKPEDIAELLMIAGHGLTQVLDRQAEPRREPLRPYISDKGKAGPAIKTQEITTAPDGTLVAPPGEHIIGCGECKHSRFYVCLTVEDDQPARLSCAHCGNEIVQRRIYHAEGTA